MDSNAKLFQAKSKKTEEQKTEQIWVIQSKKAVHIRTRKSQASWDDMIWVDNEGEERSGKSWDELRGASRANIIAAQASEEK